MHNIGFYKALQTLPTLYGNLHFPTFCNFYGSVSAILKATASETEANVISYWFQGMAREDGLLTAMSERNRVLKRGGEIDKVVERFAKGQTQTEDDGRVIQYYEKSGIEILATELPVWSHKYKFKGRLDVLGRTPEGELLIIDNKGANARKNISQTEGYFLQASAYALALKEMIRTQKSDKETKLLFDFLPRLRESDKIGAKIVYFIDDEETPEEIEINGRQPDYRLNMNYLQKLWKERVRAFYELHLVVTDKTEGFWRWRWKRIPSKDLFSAQDFEDLLRQRAEMDVPPKFKIGGKTVII